MPEDANGGEKTEDATPRKRSQSRQQGQVAFSTEVNNAILLLCGFGLLFALGPWAWSIFQAMMQAAVTSQLLIPLDTPQAAAGLFASYESIWLVLIGFMGLLFVIGLAISVAQVGIQFSAKPLMPQWSRVSPMSGLKRIFGLRGLMRFIFSVIKLVIIVVVAEVALSIMLHDQLLFTFDINARLSDSATMIIILAIVIAFALGVIALFDLIYQRWQHNKDMMMTKQEVKEEVKQSDGDPQVKAKIRQIQRQMAQGRMMQEVPQADVVVTNPTHVAVALRYDQNAMQAPVVIAKGYDLVAQQIKRIAEENGIVMVENVPLARALAKEVQIGQAIPVDFYQQVAEVLSYVYKLKKNAA